MGESNRSQPLYCYFVSRHVFITRLFASLQQLGLAIILDCLPGASIMAALALEDIAYAYYVLEYSSGNFAYAIECADVAGTLLKRLQYEVCMQAASANRVKGKPICVDCQRDLSGFHVLRYCLSCTTLSVLSM
ncbi:unnamed protein product [Dibothriocephalus latus]|uniref:Uncharacterized protein n=1 Tax=Dibothriocephalus latus TaxID=60516 RepID=A0A3P7PZY2_DIBLA|nr:unnamed protein product [Dibothriocephalus latus]